MRSAVLIEPRTRQRQLPLRNLPLASGEVHLWRLDVARLPFVDTATDNVHRLQQQRLRQRFYLRLLLAAHLGRPARDVRIGKTATGKPFIEPDAGTGRPPPLFFSLSHVGAGLLVALCREAPVGVDMELAGRRVKNPMRMAERYFHPGEVAWLKQQPATRLEDAWLRLWTCKEAVVKATGGGIVSGLHRFAVALGGGGAEITAAVNEPEDDVLHSLRISLPALCDQYYVAVAHDHNIRRIRSFELCMPSGVNRE